MNITIIGAGPAGLAAARSIRSSRPHTTITIYEKSRGLGGRVATRRRDGFVFDHGAQVIKAPSSALHQLIAAELRAELLRQITLPVWVFDGAGKITEGDPAMNAETSWYYSDGNNRLGKLLAEGLDVRREVRVARLGRSGSGYVLYDTRDQVVGQADVVLLTPPAPQTAEIIAASDLNGARKQTLADELGRASYRRCVSLAFAYHRRVDRPFYALVNTDRAHPISWLGLEHVKGAERCPPDHSLLIAQMASGWSVDHWDAAVDDVAPTVAEMMSELLGEDLRAPLWCDRQGWRYALPASGADFDALNAPYDGLFFAGDYTAGQGRVHLAIESGWRVGGIIAGLADSEA